MPKKKRGSGHYYIKRGQRGGSGIRGRARRQPEGEVLLSDNNDPTSPESLNQEAVSQDIGALVAAGNVTETLEDEVDVNCPNIVSAMEDSPYSSIQADHGREDSNVSATAIGICPSADVNDDNTLPDLESTRTTSNIPSDVTYVNSPNTELVMEDSPSAVPSGHRRYTSTGSAMATGTTCPLADIRSTSPVLESTLTSSTLPQNVPHCNTGNIADLTGRTQACTILKGTLPQRWLPIWDHEGLHAVLLSRNKKNVEIQREVYAAFTGEIEVFVHKKRITGTLYEDCLKDVRKIVSIHDSVSIFCDNILKVVLAVRSYEVCAGSDHNVKFEDMWTGDTLGFVDDNPYNETRYEKTFRSNDCSYLVPVKKWRCSECAKRTVCLREKMKRHQEEEVKTHTRNAYLDPKQSQKKLKKLQRELNNARRKIDHLQHRVSQALNQEGVFVDPEYAEDLTEILRDWGNLTPVQQMFIQQQVKSASCKKSNGMRWHPTMIRLALSIQSTSSSAYAALRDSGMVRLPCQKTLFDYSHCIPRSEGVFSEKVAQIGEKFKSFTEEHQKFVNVLMDEIHTSQKLVYRKSDGSLVGYVKLDEVEVEMQNLLTNIDGDSGGFQPAVATKVLAYMIKGCTTSVKEVVAAFPVANLTKDQLFTRTWAVIRACEGNGIKVLSIISDGCSTNRAFISMHTPATPSSSGVVFDTVNMCAPDRKIFFISDPPHLLKTIRNCFCKSGTSKRCTRLLTINGETIKWSTIERLYLTDVENTLRRSYKLTSQNVYLNSYTAMKVSYAAQVMSRTVALDLQDRNWQGTGATVKFLLMVNNFFDNLNGSHEDVARKRLNERLAPYKDVNDKRFEELREFEKYIRDWGEEAQNRYDVQKADKGKMTLSSQTVEGIYITVNGFIGAVQFLLGLGAKYVHGRSFCQDPLEQYFGKQRASLGGRNNPTVDSFMMSEIKISTHRDFNVKRRSGNTVSKTSAFELDEEPLPKRRKICPTRRKSF